MILPVILGNCSPTVSSKDTSQIVDPDYCELAQVNLQKIHCKEGEPTKRGTSFANVCRDIQTNGGVGLNAKCLSTITSCLDIDKCLNGVE